MKADRMGTHTEQVRARMGWKSPKERKALGLADSHVCAYCHFFWLKEIPNRDGGCSNYSPYCAHPQAAGEYGYATRETAFCDKWERKV